MSGIDYTKALGAPIAHEPLLPQRVSEQFEKICAYYWTRASRDLQGKYPQHQPRTTMNAGFMQLLNAEGYFTNAAIILYHLTGVRNLSLTDPPVREAGMLLRVASYAHCQIGGPAAFGDLQWYYYCNGDSAEEDAISDEMLEHLYEWKRGNGMPARVELRRRFAQLCAELPSRIPEGKPFCLWRLDEDGWTYNHDVAECDYYLLRSLLRFVEGEGGHA